MKKIIAILLCLCTAFTICACSKSNTDNTPETTDVATQPTESTITLTEYPIDSDKYVAQSFLKSLLEKDFDAARDLLNVPNETPFFTGKDVEWYLERSAFKKIIDIDTNDYDIVFKEEIAVMQNRVPMIVKDKTNNLEFEFVVWVTQNENNEWKVRDDSFYHTEYYVVTPGGDSTAKFNDINIEDYTIGYFDTNQYRKLYKLEYVGKSEQTMVVTAETFGESVEKFYPEETTENEPYEIQVLYKEDDVLSTLQNCWVDYHELATNKEQVDVNVYFTENVTDIDKENILNSVKEIYTKPYHNFQMTGISHCFGEKYQSRWLTDEHIIVYFNYSIDWVFDPSYANAKNEKMSFYSEMIFKVTEDGTKLIDSTESSSFFASCSNSINKSR